MSDRNIYTLLNRIYEKSGRMCGANISTSPHSAMFSFRDPDTLGNQIEIESIEIEFPLIIGRSNGNVISARALESPRGNSLGTLSSIG